MPSHGLRAKPWSTCQAMVYMPSHGLRAKPWSTCQAMVYVPSHGLHAKPWSTCQAMVYMPSHGLRAKPWSTCQAMVYVPSHGLRAKPWSTCQAMVYVPSHGLRAKPWSTCQPMVYVGNKLVGWELLNCLVRGSMYWLYNILVGPSCSQAWLKGLSFHVFRHCYCHVMHTCLSWGHWSTVLSTDGRTGAVSTQTSEISPSGRDYRPMNNVAQPTACQGYGPGQSSQGWRFWTCTVHVCAAHQQRCNVMSCN